MVTHCKTIDIRVTLFTLFYSIHCQKTHQDTFRALSFLILVSPTCFTRASLYSNSFPRRFNEVSVHSISRSSSWIGRWLSRDISCDINKELIFYLDALSGKNIQAWQGHTTYVYASVNLTGERRHFLGPSDSFPKQCNFKCCGWTTSPTSQSFTSHLCWLRFQPGCLLPCLHISYNAFIHTMRILNSNRYKRPCAERR